MHLPFSLLEAALTPWLVPPPSSILKTGRQVVFILLDSPSSLLRTFEIMLGPPA